MINKFLNKTYLKYVLVIFILAALGIAFFIIKNNTPLNIFGKKFIKNPPIILMSRMYDGQSLSSFTKDSVSIIKQYAKDRAVLNKQDVDGLQEGFIRNTVKGEMGIVFMSNKDSDDRVTRDELSLWLREHDASRKYKVTSVMINFDNNGDQNITNDELLNFNLFAFGPIYKAQINELFEIDPNHDNKLEIKELEKISQQIFNMVDVDKNLSLSQSEIDAQLKNNNFRQAYKATQGKAADVDMVPNPLIVEGEYSSILKIMGFGSDLARFTSSMLANARTGGVNYGYNALPSQTSLTKEIADNSTNMALDQSLSTQITFYIAALVRLDKDRDGQITVSEIESVTKNNFLNSNKADYYLDVADSNNDYIISLDEIYNIDSVLGSFYKNDLSSTRKKSTRIMYDLLSLDPNKDGKLEEEEIKEIARKIFLFVDKNGDSKITYEEVNQVRSTFAANINLIMSGQYPINPPEAQEVKDVAGEKVNSVPSINNFINKPYDAVPTGCVFRNLSLPTKFSVFAAGGSSLSTKFQIDQSGSQAGQINVTVNSPNEPVVLMLGNYSPTIWNINWTQNTKIVAVMVSGYNRQVVAGLDKKVPILNSTFENKGACGYFYIDDDELQKLNPVSKNLFGKQVDMVYFAKNGSVVVGNPLSQDAKLINSPEITPESFYNKSAPIAGPLGLQDAVSKGFLRPATIADTQAWLDVVAEKNANQRDIPPTNKGNEKRTMGAYNSYVVLKPFVYPAGLYGGLSATFFIPKGVKTPEGDPGHSSVYDFNSSTCNGPLCMRD